MKIKELRQLCFDEKNDDFFFSKKNRENVAVSRQKAFNNFDLTKKIMNFFVEKICENIVKFFQYEKFVKLLRFSAK